MTTPVRNPFAARRRHPHGMTLVELLVVTGLIGVFLGLVVVGVRRGTKSGVEPLPSVLAAAHGRALGVPEGAAVILAPDGGAPAACTLLYDAVMQPLIEANVTGVPPGTASSITATGTVVSLTGDDPQRAYKILLSGQEPTSPPTAWMAYTPVSGTTGVIGFRTSLGQTTGNTVWPKPPASGTFNAILAQYPAKSTATFAMDQGMAVDLRFSGIGDNPTTTYGRLDGKGAVAVVFDRVGRVAEVIQSVPDPGTFTSGTAAQPAIPVGTIYFCVTPLDLITSGSNTLASGDTKWVALVPQTGRIFVADNVVQPANDVATVLSTGTTIADARAKVRVGIGVGK